MCFVFPQRYCRLNEEETKYGHDLQRSSVVPNQTNGKDGWDGNEERDVSSGLIDSARRLLTFAHFHFDFRTHLLNFHDTPTNRTAKNCPCGPPATLLHLEVLWTAPPDFPLFRVARARRRGGRTPSACLRPHRGAGFCLQRLFLSPGCPFSSPGPQPPLPPTSTPATTRPPPLTRAPPAPSADSAARTCR